MDTHVQPFIRGKTVIVGIGNPLRGDDGFGPALVARLHGKVNAICIDAGNAPENYLGRIVKEAPETIVLVDVAHLGLDPGQYRFLLPEEILQHGLTTHDMSSRMLIEFLHTETSATIMMLAVQPQQLVLGEPLSAPVTEALNRLEQVLHEATHA